MSLLMKNWNNTLMKARPLFGGSWNPIGIGNIVNAPCVKAIVNYVVDAYNRDAYTLEMEENIHAGDFGFRTGSFSPVKNINKVKEVAGYAITKYNKRSGANLKLEKVISCDSQIVGGRNYRFILPTNEGFAKAMVYTRSWENFIKLTHFEHLPSTQSQSANA